MNTDLKLPAITLHHGQSHRIEAGKGLLVQCLAGTLWLTQDNDPRDIVLEPGQEATIERSGLSIVSALCDARFVLLSAGAPAPGAAAAETGLQRMVGDVLTANRAMLSLAHCLGFKLMRHPDGGVQVLRVQRSRQRLDGRLDVPIDAPIAPGLSALPESART